MKNMIFFNTGWMKSYNGIKSGIDKIEGGGSWVDEHGYGHEMYNFREINGKMYGFVQPNGRNNLERLGVRENSNSISDILVVWMAKQPSDQGFP